MSKMPLIDLQLEINEIESGVDLLWHQQKKFSLPKKTSNAHDWLNGPLIEPAFCCQYSRHVVGHKPVHWWSVIEGWGNPNSCVNKENQKQLFTAMKRQRAYWNLYVCTYVGYVDVKRKKTLSILCRRHIDRLEAQHDLYAAIFIGKYWMLFDHFYPNHITYNFSVRQYWFMLVR